MEFRHIERNKCMGCGLCFSVCQFEAIEIVKDEFGFIPRLIEENCTDCGDCTQVCPGINVLDYPGKFGAIHNCLLCSAKDEAIRYAASSGGACRAIMAALLDKGHVDRVIVTRATGDPYEPETIITDKISDLMSDRLNSIYSPSSPMAALKDLGEGFRYAFIGLPCHIAGLKLCPEIRKKIFVIVGIFCNHTPSFKFVDKFIHDKSGDRGVDRIRYRGDGWPGKTIVFQKNGSTSEFGFPDMWYKYNYNREFQLNRCSECTYYSSEFADISIGDPWHLIGQDQEGSSLVLIRSEKGTYVMNASESWVNMKTVSNIEEAMRFHDLTSQVKQENKDRIESSAIIQNKLLN
ncbi:MAG: Coenzyme F420 hydrogenase/dehydrogenase, beta subunit C-terminal domain [Smithella sp.]